MAIAPPNGGLYKALTDLRKTKGKSENNMFKALGYDYYYVEKGNDIQTLINAFKEVKDTNKPTVVHIHTIKGKGYFQAEKNKEEYHWILPNTLRTRRAAYQPDSYAAITAEYLLKAKKDGKPIVAVTPATPGATGFTKNFRNKMGKNYTDVDIAEQHAVGYVSGLAKNGAKPVLAVCSSFIQRAYDQLSQDFALNNAPATILVFNGGISSADMTHLGIFDILLKHTFFRILIGVYIRLEDVLRVELVFLQCHHFRDISLCIIIGRVSKMSTESTSCIVCNVRDNLHRVSFQLSTLIIGLQWLKVPIISRKSCISKEVQQKVVGVKISHLCHAFIAIHTQQGNYH